MGIRATVPTKQDGEDGEDGEIRGCGTEELRAKNQSRKMEKQVNLKGGEGIARMLRNVDRRARKNHKKIK